MGMRKGPAKRVKVIKILGRLLEIKGPFANKLRLSSGLPPRLLMPNSTKVKMIRETIPTPRHPMTVVEPQPSELADERPYSVKANPTVTKQKPTRSKRGRFLSWWSRMNKKERNTARMPIGTLR